MDTVNLDPEIEALLPQMPTLEYDATVLPSIREAAVAVLANISLSDAVERSEHVVQDDPRVQVRVHRPRDVTGPLPCIYSIHGGGYILGTTLMDDPRFDDWVPRFGCVGISVEYRLAPETPYPGPLEDCYAGLRWTYEHADELGIDRDRIGVSGGSAGGGLAAALALLARDRNEIPVAFQLLEAPMLDDRQVTSSSRLDGLPIWTREANRFGWQSYLGDLYGTDAVPAYAAPARADDLSGLPPALVVVGGADGFRDEAAEYALRMNQAGVRAELHVFPGAPHGAPMFGNSTVVRRMQHVVHEWLSLQLG
jgi:acetyl esterase/lipase